MKIYIGGHKELLGNVLLRELAKNKKYEIITQERSQVEYMQTALILFSFYLKILMFKAILLKRLSN
jgi:hypothetical protein